MDIWFQKIVKHSKSIVCAFFLTAIISLCLVPFVGVNYDMNDYLPQDAPISLGIEAHQLAFDGEIPNARIMLSNVSISEALDYKAQLATIEGVLSITWLDDIVDLDIPLAFFDSDLITPYYRDSDALLTLTIVNDGSSEHVHAIRELLGEEHALSGSAISTALAIDETEAEVAQIALFAIIFTFFVLILTTTSWIEPVVIFVGLGIAVAINAGSNLMFQEISFVTNAAGNILQLAISLDYSVFLLHRFNEIRLEEPDPKKAMVLALKKSCSSILSSGVTTVIGFLALVVMRFAIGPDLGLALAKGIFISILTVFLYMPGWILVCTPIINRTSHRSFLPRFTWLGTFVLRIKTPVLLVFTILIVPSFLLSSNNSFYYGANYIFDETTSIGRDAQNMEITFGQSDTYVILVPRNEVSQQESFVNFLQQQPEIDSILTYHEQIGPFVPESFIDKEITDQLLSQDYSRIIIDVNTPYEGATTFALIESLRDQLQLTFHDDTHLIGEGVGAYDLMDTITTDMLLVNMIAIGAVFFMLLFTMKSITLPVLLILCIETAIWINLSIPLIEGSTLFYITYLIISTIQLGATVDYAILLTDRYKEYRTTLLPKPAMIATIDSVAASILTSGSVLTVVGFLMGWISSHGILSQLGTLLGQGTLCSMIIVFFVLPGCLYNMDTWIQKTTYKTKFINQRSSIYEKKKN